MCGRLVFLHGPNTVAARTRRGCARIGADVYPAITELQRFNKTNSCGRLQGAPGWQSRLCACTDGRCKGGTGGTRAIVSGKNGGTKPQLAPTHLEQQHAENALFVRINLSLAESARLRLVLDALALRSSTRSPVARESHGSTAVLSKSSRERARSVPASSSILPRAALSEMVAKPWRCATWCKSQTWVALSLFRWPAMVMTTASTRATTFQEHDKLQNYNKAF